MILPCRIDLKVSVAPTSPVRNRTFACLAAPVAMHPLVSRPLRTLACIALTVLGLCTRTAHADVFADGDHLMLQFGPYVYHHSYSAEHNNLPLLVGLEWESASRWELGASYFRNSFHQPCLYLYGGRRWFWRPADDGFYFKLTGGPLYGYKAPYDDKVPLNENGVGLAIIPAVGYQYQRANAQLVILGTAAIMFTFGYDFGK
jgi:hypothetical protein